MAFRPPPALALLLAGVVLLLLGSLVAGWASEGRSHQVSFLEASGNEARGGGAGACGVHGFHSEGPGRGFEPQIGDCLALFPIERSELRLSVRSDRPVTVAVMTAADYGGWILGGPLNASVVLAPNVTSWDGTWVVPVWDLFWPAPYTEATLPPSLRQLESRARVSAATHGYLVLLPGTEAPRQLDFHVVQETAPARFFTSLSLALQALGSLLVVAGVVTLRRRRADEATDPQEPGPLETLRALLDHVDRWLLYRQLVPMGVAVLLLFPVAMTLWTFAAATNPGDYRGPFAALQDPSPASSLPGLLLPPLAIAALVAAWWVLLREAGGRLDRWRARLAKFRAEEEDLLERL